MGTLSDTIDAFHRGRFFLVQPRLTGHRSGMDAMLLASLVPSTFSGRLLDIGAGAGAVGLAVVSRCVGASAVLLEKSDLMLGYAEKTLELPQNADFCSRLQLLKGDITWPGKQRESIGLRAHSFDFALMNPPFNHARDQPTPDQLKAEAHIMPPNMFEQWARAAAHVLRPGGLLGVIARPESLVDILAALNGRFGSLQIIAVHAHAHRPAIRLLVHGKCGSRSPLRFLPPLILHNACQQAFTPYVDMINNGQKSLWEIIGEA